MRFAASNGSLATPHQLGRFFFSLDDLAGKVLSENFSAGLGGAWQICR
jgi:hypothetical protein